MKGSQFIKQRVSEENAEQYESVLVVPQLEDPVNEACSNLVYTRLFHVRSKVDTPPTLPNQSRAYVVQICSGENNS